MHIQIKIYINMSEMTGKGEEWLVDSFGNARAVFMDGNLQCQILYMGDSEKTKAA
jgi:hypothetical protein